MSDISRDIRLCYKYSTTAGRSHDATSDHATSDRVRSTPPRAGRTHGATSDLATSTLPSAGCTHGATSDRATSTLTSAGRTHSTTLDRKQLHMFNVRCLMFLQLFKLSPSGVD